MTTTQRTTIESQIASSILWNGVQVEHQYDNVYRVQLVLVDADQYAAARNAVMQADYTVIGEGLYPTKHAVYGRFLVLVRS